MNSDEPIAAIAPDRSAVLYGAKILAAGIQDSENNVTRFVVVGTHDSDPTGTDKTSLCFTFAEDKPGQLMNVMAEFADRAVLQGEDYRSAVIGLATTTLRAVVGDIDLDDVLSQRERINNLLRERLDSETERWGIKVTNVEIREIEPEGEIQEAMNKQMSAERVRRAVVREAQGTREAAITVAEGEKQAAILKAEGIRQAEILTAEGDQQAQDLRAAGYAKALDNIEKIAKGIKENTLSLQYFQTLKEIGASESTKYIFPMEFTGLLKDFLNKTKKD